MPHPSAAETLIARALTSPEPCCVMVSRLTHLNAGQPWFVLLVTQAAVTTGRGAHLEEALREALGRIPKEEETP